MKEDVAGLVCWRRARYGYPYNGFRDGPRSKSNRVRYRWLRVPGFEPTLSNPCSNNGGSARTQRRFRSIVRQRVNNLLISPNCAERGALIVVLFRRTLVGVLQKPGSDAHMVPSVGRHGVDTAIAEEVRID